MTIMSSVKFKCIPFNALTINELYALLALRSEVFVVEQNCVFLDVDGKDEQALHCLGFDENNKLVSYTRLFDKDVYYEGFTSIGRVVSAPSARSRGIGRELMQQSIAYCKGFFGDVPIKIGAQKYLLKFYESFGFKTIGQDYLEDGIEHTIMVRT